jgi:hypothetical protein
LAAGGREKERGPLLTSKMTLSLQIVPRWQAPILGAVRWLKVPKLTRVSDEFSHFLWNEKNPEAPG